MKTVKIEVHVPARGEPPRRSYHSDLSRMSGLLREPRPYREAEWREVEVLGVPVEVSPRQVQEAIQYILNDGGGFGVPVDWQAVVRELSRRGLEINLQPVVEED